MPVVTLRRSQRRVQPTDDAPIVTGRPSSSSVVFLCISVVLTVGLKSVSLLGPIMFPIMSALAVVAAVLNLSGESLSLFHVASFLLVIGLGLDYALFFNRLEGNEEGRLRTLYGLLVCSTTTILVFGVLASFDHSGPACDRYDGRDRIILLSAVRGMMAKKVPHAA